MAHTNAFQTQLVLAQDMLTQSIIANEYGDIRSILDEVLPSPTWAEQVTMTRYLGVHVRGALFSYDPHIGWSYVEEGE